jgi:Zn-dependent protease
MNDPFAWSLPLGRLFGVTIRVHWLFPFVAIGYVLHVAWGKTMLGGGDSGAWGRYPSGAWVDACVFMLLLFVSVLLHEYGHCFAARGVGGEANEVLLWPLGGLANVEVPHRPAPHFLTAAAGPATNVVLALLCLLVLLCLGESSVQPAWNPLPGGENSFPMRIDDGSGRVRLFSWSGEEKLFAWYHPSVWLVRFFWINYFMALLNVVLCGFPLDGGRMLQASLWPSLGYRQSMLAAIFVGFGIVFVVGLYAIIFNSVLSLCLALFIYVSCQRQWVMLETGDGEGVFGYDFSQGYTSLERDQVQAAPTPKPKQSWWRRWLARRAQRRLQAEIERREAEEKRMDELLQKLHEHKQGGPPLTDEEQRFMKRVADRYRNNRR